MCHVLGLKKIATKRKPQKNTIKLDLGKLWVIKDVYTGLGSGCFNRQEDLNRKILVIRLVQEIIKNLSEHPVFMHLYGR